MPFVLVEPSEPLMSRLTAGPLVNPSIVDLIVVLQARRHQIDICQRAPEYPRNAVVPANRKAREQSGWRPQTGAEG